MLNFLRRHQRIFFIVITVAIVISFCFFGRYSTMGGRQEIPDKEVVCGVCGSPIMQQELAALCRLIESSPFDRSAMEKAAPNFLNDGVIEKDFMASGLAFMLAKEYFDQLKGDLGPRMKKVKAFRPYVHPAAPQISAEKAWGRYAPSLLEHLRLLKEKGDSLTTETLGLYIQLYLDQLNLPPDVLKQILTMQQNQQGLQPDSVLANADLSLFGFKSVHDWFGPQFVSSIGQFTLNAAQIAEQNGYDVKKEEVRADLFQNVYRGYQETYHTGRTGQMTAEEVDQFYQGKMRSLGLDETMLVSAWRKVMLFRRLLEDGSGSVLIDPLVYQQFNQFAKENVRISLYQLPSSLQLSDFRSMLKLQVYLEAVAADPSRLRSDLKMPEQFASLENIEKRAPELVEREIELEWSGVSKEDLCRAISIKETCEWEVADGHWEMLKSQFPQLAAAQDRLAFLDKLDKKTRFKVDQFARGKMVEGQPGRIERALDVAPVKNSVVGLRLKGSILPFEGFDDQPELISLLEKSSNATNYTPDNEHYYRIRVVRREEAKKVLEFEKASSDGTLDRVLDKRLEAAYSDVRKKHAQTFQQSDGQFKPFAEVKDQVGKYVFADLLRSIEEQYQAQFGFLPGKAGELPLNFYSNARLLPFMNEVQSRLQASDGEMKALNLSSQWLVEKTEEVMERSSKAPFAKDEMFTLAPHQWSPVKIGERGAMAFYLVQEKRKASAAPLDSLEQGHQILSMDARRDMMQQLLQKMHQKKAIDISSKVIAEACD